MHDPDQANGIYPYFRFKNFKLRELFTEEFRCTPRMRRTRRCLRIEHAVITPIGLAQYFPNEACRDLSCRARNELRFFHSIWGPSRSVSHSTGWHNLLGFKFSEMEPIQTRPLLGARGRTLLAWKPLLRKNASLYRAPMRTSSLIETNLTEDTLKRYLSSDFAPENPPKSGPRELLRQCHMASCGPLTTSIALSFSILKPRSLHWQGAESSDVLLPLFRLLSYINQVANESIFQRTPDEPPT